MMVVHTVHIYIPIHQISTRSHAHSSFIHKYTYIYIHQPQRTEVVKVEGDAAVVPVHAVALLLRHARKQPEGGGVLLCVVFFESFFWGGDRFVRLAPQKHATLHTVRCASAGRTSSRPGAGAARGRGTGGLAARLPSRRRGARAGGWHGGGGRRGPAGVGVFWWWWGGGGVCALCIDDKFKKNKK